VSVSPTVRDRIWSSFVVPAITALVMGIIGQTHGVMLVSTPAANIAPSASRGLAESASESPPGGSTCIRVSTVTETGAEGPDAGSPSNLRANASAANPGHGCGAATLDMGRPGGQ